MTKYRFTEKDFDTFKIDGLDARMEGIKVGPRVKLYNLGGHFSGFLTDLTGDEQFSHVAMHARRKVNPPDDTWVAFSTNKRGYKMMPHFQIGLWGDHAFCMYGVIYESPDKKNLAGKWLDDLDLFREIPQEYSISLDHMKPAKPELSGLSDEDLEAGLIRLRDVKKGEFLVGKVYRPGDEELKTDEAFIEDLEKVMTELIKFY
ncbi:YktB family protein [Salinicoccus sp. Marseille-QA3877]